MKFSRIETLNLVTKKVKDSSEYSGSSFCSEEHDKDDESEEESVTTN